MKKNLFFILTISTILLSCSKKQRINRDLEGDWRVFDYYGQTDVHNPGNTVQIDVVFSPSMKGKGTGTTQASVKYSEEFNYNITNQRVITIQSTGTEKYMDGTFTIEKHEGNTLILMNSENSGIVLKRM